MEIYPLGHASFRIKGKAATIITDPYDPAMVGIKYPKVENFDVVTISHGHADHNFTKILGLSVSSGKEKEAFVVSGPGEYEVSGVTIVGVPTFHDSHEGAERGENTAYVMTVDGMRVCHLGDLGHKLTDEQLNAIGDVDILLVPVGGFYTIDADTASEVVAQLEPRIVVPMHYKRPEMRQEAFGKLSPVEKFLEQMGAAGNGSVRQPKLVTSKEKLPDTTTVVVLE